MRKRAILLASGCILVLQPAQADTRDDVMAAMQRCNVMTDDRTWLECTYGAQQIMRAKLGLPPAPDYQQRLVPPPAQMPAAAPQTAPRAASAAAAPAAPAVAPRRGSPSFMQVLSGKAAPISVSPLASFEFDKQGRFTVTLQNGQVWRQVEARSGSLAPLVVGKTVTITPGALWSYDMKTEGNSRVYKVERQS